jgi:hypothetical protein
MARLIRDDFIRRLDEDFRLAEKTENEVQSVLAKYICVRLCGFVEVCLKERIQNFVDYIKNAIKGTTNLNSEKLVAALGKFSKDWAEYYSERVTEEMKMSLGNIYNNRNAIAHGQNANVSLQQLKRDYTNLRAVVEIFNEAISK